MPPFGQYETVLAFNPEAYQKQIDYLSSRSNLPQGNIDAAMSFSFRAMRSTWPALEIEPYNRLQLQREHQPAAPTRPGEAGVIYLPGWIKSGWSEGRVYVTVKRNTNRWTFCGMYEARLLEGFKPLSWEAVPEEVSTGPISTAGMVMMNFNLVL